MESHLSRPPPPSLQGNRTWSFQRLAWTRGAPGALSWTTDRDVGAACIHNSLYLHIVRNTCNNGTSSQSTLIFGAHTDGRRQWRSVCASVKEERLYEEMR